MEPADIDWKNVVSRYVRDEAFENIDAPKWVDLTDLNASFSATDDAWFCRPDCKHAKIGDGLLTTPSPKGKLTRSRTEILPFGERNGNNIRENNNNLKRRGGIGALLPSSSPFKPKKTNNNNSENQDPNLPPLAAKKWKDPIKSSCEKQRDEEREQLLFQQEKNGNGNQQKLRSTLSARNLFSGRDILGQISEFCSEIKKIAVNIGNRTVNIEEDERQEEEREEKKEGIKENLVPTEIPSESGKKKKKLNTKMNLKIEIENNENGENLGTPSPSKKLKRGILKEVRENPPTPQRFLSPSPLKKPPKSTPMIF
ncbi:hypothetical protein LUZ60_006020 [Juncus effusus]|nr:hypothetical protein LUZ60_006020 [Juncus effusus]